MVGIVCSCRSSAPSDLPQVQEISGGYQSEFGNPGLPVVDAWWETLDDPVLVQFIEEAIRENIDLRASLQRIQQTRALKSAENSRLGPEIAARAGYSQDRFSENNPRFQGAIESGLFPRDVDYWDFGFDFNWELDFLGRVGSEVDAAVARVEEQMYLRRALMLSIAADVAVNYFDILGDEKRLRLLGKQIANGEKQLILLEKKVEAGLIAGNQVSQLRSKLYQFQSRMPLLEGRIRTGQYRLSVLLGQRPGDGLKELEESRSLPEAGNRIPVGLPSELLLRRPDIMAAEQRVIAATAEVDVSHDDLFPRFFLTGSPGLQSGNFSDLFSSASSSWVFGPRIKWSLFTNNRNQALLEAAQAKQMQVFTEYEAKVNQALEEVESSLVRYGTVSSSLKILSEAEEEDYKNLDIQASRRSRELIGELDVLEAEAIWLDAQNAVLDQNLLLLKNLITLHKALGGGWEQLEAMNQPVARNE